MGRPEVVRFQLGDYELDLERYELRHQGSVCPTEPQVFDVLAHLLSHHDRVVTKEELLDGVWGDRFVSESALSSRIKAARRAVGDDGQHQHVIRTVHGRGFRVVADVTVIHRDMVQDERPRLSAPGRPLRRPTSSFIGRTDDLCALSALVGTARILTICGPGGIGKSRLALEVANRIADRYPQQPRLLELAGVAAASDVAAAIASAVDVQERHGTSIVDRLVDALADERMLLVVDNCEHVRESVAPLIIALVERGAGVDVIATSRTPLRIDGEHVWPLEPLATSAPGDGDAPAVRLFLERAGAQLPWGVVEQLDRDLVRSLCERLDGVPLCLELAASRVRHLGLAGLLVVIDDPTTLRATGKRGDRHGSIEAVLAWSYDRLLPSEQRLFRRLSVFAGWFDAAAAVRLAEATSPSAVVHELSELVDQSMVRADAGAGTARYSLLAPLAQFGRRKLETTGEHDQARRRHAEWAADVAEQIDRALRGPGAAAAIARFEELVPDLRLAHRYLLDCGDVAALARLTRAVFWSAQETGPTGVLSWAEATLDATPDADAGALGVVHAAAAVAAWQRGDIATARIRAEAAVNEAREARDAGLAELALAAVRQLEGEHADVVRLGASIGAITGMIEDPMLATMAHVIQALSLGSTDDPAAATEHARIAVEIAEATGSPLALAWARYAEGEIRLEAEPDVALAHLEEALSLARRLGVRLLAGVAALSVVSLRARRAPESSLAGFAELIDHWRLAGTAAHQWTTIRNLVELLARRGADEHSARLYGAVFATGRATEPYGAEAARIHRAIGDVRNRLGETAFGRLLDEGARLSDSDTVAYARAAVTPS